MGAATRQPTIARCQPAFTRAAHQVQHCWCISSRPRHVPQWQRTTSCRGWCDPGGAAPEPADGMARSSSYAASQLEPQGGSNSGSPACAVLAISAEHAAGAGRGAAALHRGAANPRRDAGEEADMDNGEGGGAELPERKLFGTSWA